MNKFLLLAMVAMIQCLQLFSEQSVTTRDGRIATLFDDGTWKYAESKDTTKAGFRSVAWGSSMDQVVMSEGKSPDYKQDNVVIYFTKVSGLACSAVYFFADNKLVRARYFFTEKHTNDNDHILDYKNIKKLLSAKYGESTDSSQVWKDDLYRDDESHWGMAIATGKMYYYSNWETSDTQLSLQLWGDNYEIQHLIEYTSRELGFLEDLEKLKEAQDKL